MKKRNRIATIVLFLAALAVGFDAQPGWCAFGTLAPGYIQCDIASFVSPAVAGMVVLQDGTVLVANVIFPTGGGLYSFKPGSPGSPCPLVPPPPTLLESSFVYLAMAVGLDGKIYANGRDGNVYTVSPTTGIPTSTVLTGVFGLGMALDPLTGDLYVTSIAGPGPNIRYITGLYGPHPTPTINPFVSVPFERFDGLAWSCNGTRLAAASQTGNVFQFDRGHNTVPGFPVHLPPTGFGNDIPDGVAFGAEGTPFAGYFFVNTETGTVWKIGNDGTVPLPNPIASGGMPGDFAAVDTNGNLLLAQSTLVTRLSTDPSSPLAGGQWVLAGSTLCSDLGCGAKAATTTQFGIISPAAPHPCLSGLNANLVLTLSQSACGSCESCNTLNQARTILLDLLNSLDPPRTCLNSLKATLVSLYNSCPCNCPCTGCNCPPYCLETKLLGGGTCIAQTKFPLGFDLESYDPILQAFIRELMSP